MAKRGGRRRVDSRHEIERIAPSTALNSESSAESSASELQVDSSDIAMDCQNAKKESRVKSKVRGKTRGIGAQKAMETAKDRLRVEFNFGLRDPICNNASTFNNEIGVIVRGNCSLRYKGWRDVPPNVRLPLREKLLKTFDVDIADKNVQDLIDAQMGVAFRGYKYTLHKIFKENGGDGDLAKARCSRPADVKEEDWEFLCDLWTDNNYKNKAKKNAESRSKRKWESRNGSRSTARHHVVRGVELDAPTGQIETWRLRYWKDKKGWSSPELEAKYEEMMQLRRDNSVENMTDKMILEKVLGRQSNRLFGWGRSPSKSRRTCHECSRRPTYTEALDELKDDFQKLKQKLIDKNILPDSSLSCAPSDRYSPSRGDASPADQNDIFSQHNSKEIVGEDDMDMLNMDEKANGNKKKQQKEPTANSNMPIQLYWVNLHYNTVLKDKGTVMIRLDKDVFGHERVLYILKEDVEYTFKLLPITCNCIVLYIWRLYMKMGSTKILEKFKFVDPLGVGDTESKEEDEDTIKKAMEKRAHALSIGLKGTSTNQLVLVPVNVGHHWILTVIKPHTEEVGLLDSLYLSNHDVAWKQIVEMALEMFNAGIQKKGKGVSWTIFKGPKQPDCVQCGFYVMRYMKEIIALQSCETIGSIKSLGKTFNKEGKKRYSDDEINEVRKEWAKCLQKYLKM